MQRFGMTRISRSMAPRSPGQKDYQLVLLIALRYLVDPSVLFNGSLFSITIGFFKGTIGGPINRIMHFYDPPKVLKTFNLIKIGVLWA